VNKLQKKKGETVSKEQDVEEVDQWLRPIAELRKRKEDKEETSLDHYIETK